MTPGIAHRIASQIRLTRPYRVSEYSILLGFPSSIYCRTSNKCHIYKANGRWKCRTGPISQDVFVTLEWMKAHCVDG